MLVATPFTRGRYPILSNEITSDSRKEGMDQDVMASKEKDNVDFFFFFLVLFSRNKPFESLVSLLKYAEFNLVGLYMDKPPAIEQVNIKSSFPKESA